MTRAARRIFPLVFALLGALLGACGAKVEVPKVPGLTPYRITIQQGNFISREMVEQLKPGMTREQVRYVLGTPMVSDIFHADRWDYVFSLEQPDGKREQRNLSVIFEGGKLQRVVGDLLPSEAELKAQQKPKPSAAELREMERKAAEEKRAAEAKKAADERRATEEKRAAEKKAADDRRAEERRVAEERRAAEKKAAEDRRAEERRAEEKRAEERAAEEKAEPGFWDRVREKLTPARAQAKPAPEAPKAEAPKAEAAKAEPAKEEPKQEPAAPAEAKKEPGFFDRVRQKLGL